MTIDWHIDTATRVVHLRYAGHLVFSHWADTMRAIFAHPDYVPGMGFVAQIDGSLPPDTAYLLKSIEFVEQHAAQFLDCRWANVTTNPAHYGMTRVAQARSHDVPSTLGIFSTVAEAVAWVSAPRDESPESP